MSGLPENSQPDVQSAKVGSGVEQVNQLCVEILAKILKQEQCECMECKLRLLCMIPYGAFIE